jgi:prepilin-type N-terminal cleavage/methylation domain-containing protein
MKQANPRVVDGDLPGAAAGRKAGRGRGFTLLEVLAAVAILGIWYMVAATIAMQGLRAEGQSQRQIRASLIADGVLADLESDFALASPPPAQDDETEQGDFTIRVEIKPYELTLPGTAQTKNAPTPALEKLSGSGGHSVLSQVRVEVRWADGVDEQSVIRETFGLDLGPAVAALQAATPTAPPKDSSEEGQEEGIGTPIPSLPGTDAS